MTMEPGQGPDRSGDGERPADDGATPSPVSPTGPAHPVEPMSPLDFRASDGDRTRVLEALDRAFTDGRIDNEEHSQRADACWSARTYRELIPLLVDIPDAAGLIIELGGAHPLSSPTTTAPYASPSFPSPSQESGMIPVSVRAPVVKRSQYPPPPETVIGVLSESKRDGIWHMPQRLNAVAFWGSVQLDLRQATLEAEVVTVSASAIMGQVEIIVPPGIQVKNSAAAIMGEVKVEPAAFMLPPTAPTLHITGFAFWAQILVTRKAL